MLRRAPERGAPHAGIPWCVNKLYYFVPEVRCKCRALGHDLDILETSRHTEEVTKINLDENFIDKGYFQDLKDHVSHNYMIAEFYESLYGETGDFCYLNKSKAIDTCCAWWDMDCYRLQNIKDIKRVNLCRDKFCFNCQSMLALKRQGKFAPQLDSLRGDFIIAHVIFTVPNCEAEELEPLLDIMYKKFPFLMRYFRGKAKVRGVDFNQYGYGGGVRGLEVTYNKEDKSFHPHFHCMLLFRPDLDLTGKYINSFSYDRGKLVRKFSELEILLQKVWYLLMNCQTVTAQAIKNLKEGYSVQVLDSKGYYHEAFKYSCKGAFDETKGAFIYDELIFRTLQSALHGRRMIQGYGLLHNFNDLDGEILEADLQEAYAHIIADLKAIESPDFYCETLDEVIERSATCKYISKSNLKRLLIERRRQEQGG